MHQDAATPLARLVHHIARVVHGKHEAITLAVVGLAAEGHVLLEDVPGTGKTTLARALARSIDVDFSRIQFTSDLLPADVLGFSAPSPTDGHFVFRRGPIFGNIVLADELNRSTPRTQSALLECMNERRASVDGDVHELERPFMVIATQNPLEFEGTYPLPESQLDRFMLRVRLGYPERAVERQVLKSRLAGDPLDELQPVLTRQELLDEIEAVRRVHVEDLLLDYALDLIETTRTSGRFLLGASPRAGIGWMRAAQALARIDGRDHALPDDVKRLAVPVLAHRVVQTPRMALGGGAEDGGVEQEIAALLEEVPVPA
ncbi:MAG: MoxR family ATPase [Planctomycetes bacterium]|nr:MoxR family ATPase [Planctomycetota bacterium]MCB9904849.1 MoxR family ATPase [Planctomycetota bacterium]